MFDKILIANRGEIAIRIIRTCKRLGIGTVAVFSEADVRSIYIREADEAVFLGPASAKDSYLVKEKLIESALAHQCKAVHPGYGFLSENAEFAQMVAQAGLVFIGPPAAAIATLGDKIASKALAIQAGVPVVPGHTKNLSLLEEAVNVADQIGYPVLLKPAAGGGGKGMRIVFSEKELKNSLNTCRQEAKKAFGDDTIFMERYIVSPRHVEMQILADHHGNAVYLGERECSIQRRYQKIIEETPSMAVDGALRERMGKMACDLALKAGYANAGTVEFILDQEGNFYFIEVNTRLQVEHPVTEMVTGLDLVELQLRIADGEALAFDQKDIILRGWSIEARICAEDPRRDFYPSTGIITRYTSPRGRDIRIDTGIEAGSVVSIYYDSLLAKAVAWGETREEARKALVNGLNGYHIEGLATNLDFANAILNHPSFVKGELSTDFIESHFEKGRVKLAPPPERIHLMSIAATLVYHNRQRQIRESLRPMAAHVGGVFTPKEYTPYVVKGENDILELRLQGDHNVNEWTVWVNDTEYNVVTPDFEFYRRRLKLRINGELHMFRLQYHGNFIWAAFCGTARIFEIYSPREWALAQYMPTVEKRIRANVLECPMPGLIVDIRVQKGDRVYKGQELVMIEAMKLESAVASPCDGEIEEVMVTNGQAVDMGNILVVFKV